MGAKLFNLTVRERETISLAFAGEPCKGIADRLKISEGTVKFHLRNVRKKCGAVNTIHCAALILQN